MKQPSTVIDQWLESKESELKSLGFRRYVQHLKSEDFAYWKTYFDGERKAYQIGLLFYDFRMFQNRLYSDYHPVRISYTCLLVGNHRVELCISTDTITLEEFEQMARAFYIAMSPFFPGLHSGNEED